MGAELGAKLGADIQGLSPGVFYSLTRDPPAQDSTHRFTSRFFPTVVWIHLRFFLK